MEAYYGTVDSVRHVIYVGDSIVAADGEVLWEVTDLSGEEIAQGTAVADDQEFYVATLGTDVTGDMRPKLITWRYTIDNNLVSTSPELIEIVRPYITIDAYNREARGEELFPSEFRPLEREVRNVINSYCRQDFQLTEDTTITVSGSGGNAIQLPRRLVRLHGINVANEPLGILIEGFPGYYGDDTRHERNRAPGLDIWSISNYVTFDSDNPWEIRRRVGAEAPHADPTRRYEFFKPGRFYSIHGDWGWEHVPSIVQQAAGILIKDYLDDDSKYREKWITSVRAADWRMEFGATGNETTGHANVDMMLERFRNYRWEVV